MDRYSTIPKWLSGLGVTTYVYDYRGYGQSTGFPSERGLYRDVEAVWAEAQKRDQATPRQTLVFGHSLGGGPAAYLAEKYELAVLVTAAAFTSLPERIHSDPTFGPLSPFVFDRYPNTDRIRRLKSTRLIVLHAAHDHGMPRWMAEKLKNAYRGSAGAHLIESPTAGHGDIISQVPQLAEPFLRDLQ